MSLLAVDLLMAGRGRCTMRGRRRRGRGIWRWRRNDISVLINLLVLLMGYIRIISIESILPHASHPSPGSNPRYHRYPDRSNQRSHTYPERIL